MFFKRKKDIVQEEISFEKTDNRVVNEYNLLISRYGSGDSRRKFVDAYIFYLNTTKKINVVNVLINEGDNPEIWVYLENMNKKTKDILAIDDHVFENSFKYVSKKYPIRGLNQDSKIKFILKNAELIQREKALADATLALSDITDKYPEVELVACAKQILVVLKDEDYDLVIKKTEYLEELRKHIYRFVMRNDKHNVWIYEDFHLKITSSKVFENGNDIFWKEAYKHCLVF